MRTLQMKRGLFLIMALVCILTGVAMNKNVVEAFDKKKLAEAEVGDVVTFGKYKYKYDYTYNSEDKYVPGKKQNAKMKWIVLDKKDGKLLLLSKYCIGERPYTNQNGEVTWKTCTLRKWLNKKFIKNAFTNEERAIICTTKVKNMNNAQWGMEDGKDTKDEIFLLSIEEEEEYFPDMESRVATSIGGETCCCWLRSLGYSSYVAAVVDSDGSVDYYGRLVHYDNVAVRPALWVNLDS